LGEPWGGGGGCRIGWPARDEIEERIAVRGPDAQRDRAAITSTFEARMPGTWVESDLPSRFGTDRQPGGDAWLLC
jgi:hypothetical protein